MSDKKKELLDVRLTHLEGDTPDTLRIVAQARAGLGLSQIESDLLNESSDNIEGSTAVPTEASSDQAMPMRSLGSVAGWGLEDSQLEGRELDSEADESISEGHARFGGVKDRFIYMISGFVPKRGDPPLEIVRKCIFIVALITLIVSLTYIINDMVIIPMKNANLYNSIEELYDPNNPAEPPADFPEGNYPDGIMDTFKALYAKNNQIRGWMRYTDVNRKWLNINYPVMFSGDNKYYLTRDFQKTNNKNGALFFDERTDLESPESTNRVLIVYGHNMASGQMLSPLNKFLNNLSYMRSAPLISLDTLYERGQYQVFSVMLLSTREKDGPYFDYLRTRFSDDQDYLEFIANIRARSVYDFNGVDVGADDELLILSTCTADSAAKFKEGRCVVVARKVGDGETVAVRESDIVKNKNVIMPYAWYVNQKKTPHKYYTGGYTIPGVKTTTTVSYGDTTMPTTYTWTRDNSPGTTPAPGTNTTIPSTGDTTASGTTKTTTTTKGSGTDGDETTTTTTTQPATTTTTDSTEPPDSDN